MDEQVPIVGLSHGTGRNGIGGGVETVGDGLEALERGDTAIDCVIGKNPDVARHIAKPNGLLVGGQHREFAIVVDRRDQKMDRVGANVDGGMVGRRVGHAERASSRFRSWFRTVMVVNSRVRFRSNGHSTMSVSVTPSTWVAMNTVPTL